MPPRRPGHHDSARLCRGPVEGVSKTERFLERATLGRRTSGARDLWPEAYVGMIEETLDPNLAKVGVAGLDSCALPLGVFCGQQPVARLAG